MSDVLTEICNHKREEVAARKAEVPEPLLRARIADVNDPIRSFYHALKSKADVQETALIAEVKKASPSKGLIRENFHPLWIARSYRDAGAACISVLTDEKYFQGHDVYLKSVRDAVDLPVLRKDFMLEPYQIVESRALGADAVLIIMAALSSSEARALEVTATELGMDVLVEVHDGAELDRALTHLSSPLIGINNRNLKTMQVDTSTTLALKSKVPDDKLVVCESGIATREDVEAMQAAGVHTFLVGESLMRESDVAVATKALLGVE